jgi:hypothetical protein
MIFEATPSYRLILDGESRDTLTRQRWLVSLGRDRERGWKPTIQTVATQKKNCITDRLKQH